MFLFYASKMFSIKPKSSWSLLQPNSQSTDILLAQFNFKVTKKLEYLLI